MEDIVMRTIGVEREWFITKEGKITPAIGVLLPLLHRNMYNGFHENNFGYELFAGQLEERTKVCLSTQEILLFLEASKSFCLQTAESANLGLMCRDFVAEEELGELVVNPFDYRHQKIWSSIDNGRKIAASQVAAIHIHVSVSAEEAVTLLNNCRIEKIQQLSLLGDFSNGQRLDAYRRMAKASGEPPIFSGPEDLFAYINKAAGERNIWDLVRYKPSTGTIEFRMFGSTDDNEKIKQMLLATCDFITSIVG